MTMLFSRIQLFRFILIAFCLLLASSFIFAQSQRGSGPLLYPPGEGKSDRARDEEAWLDQSEQLLYRLQLLEEEIAKLSGVIEEQGIGLKRLTEEQKKRYLDLDQRIGKLSQAAISNSSASPPPRSAPSSPEQAAYNQARELAQQKRFEDAIKAFDTVVQKHPQSSQAASSLYWLGELYLLLPEPKVEQSRQAYIRLLDRFPNSKRIPTTLYKLGIIYNQLGQRDKSKEYFDRVVKEYPGSSAARLTDNYRSNPG